MGFLNFTGYLGGAESYYGPNRWEDGMPLNTTEYVDKSSNYPLRR